MISLGSISFDLSIFDVAVATGFCSDFSLSRAYRAQFATPPSRDRREVMAKGREGQTIALGGVR